MVVYVVFEHERYEGSTIAAIFDSEEKANDYIRDNLRDNSSIYWFDWEEYEVQ